MRDGKAWAAFAGMTLIWGSTFLAVRVADDHGYDPLGASWLRLAGMAALLLLIAAATRARWPRGRLLGVLALAGVLGFGVNFTLLFYGEQRVPSGTAAVMWGIYPTLVTLGAARFLVGEPLTARRIAGAGLAALGLVVVFRAQLGAAPLLSLGAVLTGIVCSTAGSLLFKRFGKDVDPVVLNGIATTASAGALLPVVLAAHAAVLPPDRPALLALGYLTIVGGSAFLLWAWLLQRWPATRVSYQTVLSPLVAVLLGALLLGERVEPLFLAGGALVLLGTWVAITAHAAT